MHRQPESLYRAQLGILANPLCYGADPFPARVGPGARVERRIRADAIAIDGRTAEKGPFRIEFALLQLAQGTSRCLEGEPKEWSRTGVEVVLPCSQYPNDFVPVLAGDRVRVVYPLDAGKQSCFRDFRKNQTEAVPCIDSRIPRPWIFIVSASREARPLIVEQTVFVVPNVGQQIAEREVKYRPNVVRLVRVKAGSNIRKVARFAMDSGWIRSRAR